MSLLEIRNLNVSYKTQRGVARAVRDLSLNIELGETYGLVGESGCGKSTAALTIMRYLPRRTEYTGQILFKGKDLLQATQGELNGLRGSRLSMVYQDPQSALNPVLTIGKQMVEIITAHEKTSKQEAESRVIDMLRRVHMPDPGYIMRRLPYQLSGGMQQRVIIAMALLLRPDLVLMDEPTTGLDVTVEAGVLDLLNELRREFNMAILFISHNLGVIAQLCDRVGVMYAGELIEESPMRELFDRPHHPYTVGLLRCVPQHGSRYIDEPLYTIPGRVPPLTSLPPGCKFASRCALAGPECTAVPPNLELANDHHLVRCIHWQTVVDKPALVAKIEMPVAASRSVSHDPLLLVEKLKVYFQQTQGALQKTDIKVIDEVSFNMRSATTLGIVGESGCGKSTIAATLAGLREVTAGKIDFSGYDFTQPINMRGQAAMRKLQMVFQNPDSSLNPRHTVEKILTRPLRCFNVVPRNEERSYIVSLLRAVNLDESYLERKPRQLSGGEKQRVAIARAFAGGPELVLCDEPISSLDVSVQAAVINLLQKLQRERDVALLFIAHDLNMVRYISDEVAVIYLGKICETGSTDELFQPPFHPYTEALVSAIPTTRFGASSNTIRLEGNVPSPANPPAGCRFHTRCPRKIGAICEQQVPPAQVISPTHTISCHIPADELRELQSAPLISPEMIQ